MHLLRLIGLGLTVVIIVVAAMLWRSADKLEKEIASETETQRKKSV